MTFSRILQFGLVLILCFASHAFAETRLTAPDWSFHDTFEGTRDNFWASKGASTYYGEACPGADAGDRSFVFRYVPGEPQQGHGWAERRFRLPLNAVQLEMSYDLFVPANYVRTKGNHKNFVLWSGDYGKSNANISISSESWPAGNGATPSVYIGVDGYNYGHSMLRTKPLFMENGEGKWVNIRVFLELSKGEGHYGVFEIYKNDKLITGNMHPAIETYSKAEVSKQITYAEKGNFIDQGYLLGWANGGFAEETVFCIDNFSIKANETHKALGAASARPLPPIPLS